jgi:hypothetical protein
VSEVGARGLHAAEHRALRELYATGRQLASHWERVGERFGGDAQGPLAAGAASARELLDELAERTAAYGLHGFPMAQGVGGRMANVRNLAGDRLLERNQVLRGAVLDAAHVVTLLGYLAALADRRGDAELAAWHRRWQSRLRGAQDAVEATVVALAGDPDDAIRPADESPLGRAGHTVANGVGTLGEAIDGSPLGRAARRLAGRGRA